MRWQAACLLVSTSEPINTNSINYVHTRTVGTALIRLLVLYSRLSLISTKTSYVKLLDNFKYNKDGDVTLGEPPLPPWKR